MAELHILPAADNKHTEKCACVFDLISTARVASREGASFNKKKIHIPLYTVSIFRPSVPKFDPNYLRTSFS
jgi:hypothetical protein